MIADDLFAGAGGWDLAARELGIQAMGVENMKEACATREAAGLATKHADVWTYRPDGLAEGLIASPPCQTFSHAGKGAGRKALGDVLAGIRGGFHRDIDALHFFAQTVGDPRTGLVLTPLHFAVTGGYRWLAWEQVPTVLPVWEACADVLSGLGWSTWTGYLHSEQYGVPQTRKRAFLLASLDQEVAPPAPTHSRYYSRTPMKLDEGVAKWVSMAEALGHVADGMARNSGPGAARRPRSIEEPSYTIRAQGSGSLPSGVEWVLVPANGRVRTDGGGAWPRCGHQPAPTVTGEVGGQWVWRDDLPDWCHNRPSTTIVGSFKPEIVAAPGYRTTVSRQNAPDSVRVTVQEAGVLQSFPADYPWQGAKGKQFLQAGNAIPPLMAAHALAAVTGRAMENAA